MSKSALTKYHSQSLQKAPNSIPAKGLASRLPESPIRLVTALNSEINDSKNNMLVAYKDLNQDAEILVKKQKQQMFFAFCVFFLLGIFILLGQFIAKPRMVASTSIGFAVEAEPTQVEHYQYDKSCYKGENGEQVCLTRTSQKK